MAGWDDVRRIALDLPGAVEEASFEDLDEAITDAWLCRAPRRLREQLLGG